MHLISFEKVISLLGFGKVLFSQFSLYLDLDSMQMDDLALIHITQIESDSELYLLHQQIHFEKLLHNTVRTHISKNTFYSTT